MDKKTTISHIKNQNEKVVQQVYVSFKPKFDNWLKGRYKIGDAEDRNEIYQRSFTVLFFNIKRGKLNDLEASLETYLFGIGKMVLKEWWRDKKNADDVKEFNAEGELKNADLFTSVFDANEVDENLQERLRTALDQLGEPCASIIKLFYWERNSMEAIANKTGYKNEQGAKKKKYLCLKKLKELMDA